MSAKDNQSIAIELNTKGISTIPSISPENIITIHGKNGVGKSMAATLLEIASGNYTFKNEKRFKKLANSVDSSEIFFKNGESLLFKVVLQPHIWKFDRNLNRVNTYTLGKFLEGDDEKEIDFREFIKKINVRTIRGDESLHQQVYFFKDIFIAKIEEKLKKLDKKIQYLETYDDWLKGKVNKDKIENYINLQEKQRDLLNKISNLHNTISNREANVEGSNKKLELLKELEFIAENELDMLVKSKSNEQEKLNDTEKKLSLNYKDLTDIEQRLNNLKGKFDEKTKNLIEKIDKLKKKRTDIEKKVDSIPLLKSHFKENNFSDKRNEIKSIIERNRERMDDFKKKVEKLNKTNEKVIKINNYLAQLRDLCGKASSHEFGKEKIIKADFDSKHAINISFQELFEIFENNKISFNQLQELKDYKNQVKQFNKNIKESREKLEVLNSYDKIQDKIKKLEKRLEGKTSSLDEYIDLDSKIKNLEKKQRELESLNSQLKRDMTGYRNKIEEISKKIEKVKEFPSKNVIMNDLSKLGVRIKSSEQIHKKCKELSTQIKKEYKTSIHEVERRTIELKETEKELKKLQKELDPITKEIRNAAKKLGFNDLGEFIDYFIAHHEKLKNYRNNTDELKTRLKVLKDDIEKIIEGEKPKNKAHTKIVSNQFDDIFKEIYGQEEFFEYVFKDYKTIKRFDIAEKSILFETLEGLEEKRDLEEFSSGEKTYAYCRSIISMTASVSKYNFVILDESYALLDREHSENLYQFQEKMVKERKIAKFINLLPLKEDLQALTKMVKNNIDIESKRENLKSVEKLKNQLSILTDFNQQVKERGYYQEIHYPKSKNKTLKINIGYTSGFTDTKMSTESIEIIEEEELPFCFIMDGSNIARNNMRAKNASIRDVIRVKKKLMKLGVPEKYIFIIFGSGVHHYISNRDKYDYQKLLQSRNVNQAPAERDDDWFIIKYAMNNNGYIITNDRYLEYRDKNPEYKRFIKNKSIHYTILGNDVQFDQGIEVKIKRILDQNRIKSQIREI